MSDPKSVPYQVGFEEACKLYGVQTRLKRNSKGFFGKNPAFQRMKAQKRSGKPIKKKES